MHEYFKNKSENFLKGNFSKTLKKFVGKEPDIFTMDLLFLPEKLVLHVSSIMTLFKKKTSGFLSKTLGNLRKSQSHDLTFSNKLNASLYPFIKKFCFFLITLIGR